MSAPPYMPLFVGDYLADTTHLTCTEHGAYMLLLMSMWRAGGALPNEPKKLARFARCTAGQWARMNDTIMAFFEVEGGFILHSRLAKELTRHSNAVEQRRQAASNGGKAKALKNNENTLPGASPPLCQPEPEPDTTEAKASYVEREAQAPAPKPDKLGSRLPDSWEPNDADWTRAMEALGGDIPAVNELDQFRDYWRSVPGAKARKADWDATWRTWIRRAAQTKPTPRKAHEPNHRQSFNSRDDRLRAMHAGTLAALDDALDGF